MDSDVCMCVGMYICMYGYICVSVCVVCICVYMCMYMGIYVFVCV